MVIPWSLSCLLPRLVDSGGSNQLCPACGLLATHSSSKATWQNREGVWEPRGQPADPGWQRPASPSSLSALFEIELCFLPSTRERGNGCFPFHLASAHPLPLARPLSSVQNDLGRAPRGSPDDSRPLAMAQVCPRPQSAPSRAPIATCFCSLPIALPGLERRAGRCKPGFPSRRAWGRRMPGFRRRWRTARIGRRRRRVSQEGSGRRPCLTPLSEAGRLGAHGETVEREHERQTQQLWRTAWKRKDV